MPPANKIKDEYFQMVIWIIGEIIRVLCQFFVREQELCQGLGESVRGELR